MITGYPIEILLIVYVNRYGRKKKNLHDPKIQEAVIFSSSKQKDSLIPESYFSKEFALKFVFVVVLLMVLFRVSLGSPAVVRAKGTIIKSKIMTLKIVKSIEDFDLQLEDKYLPEK